MHADGVLKSMVQSEAECYAVCVYQTLPDTCKLASMPYCRVNLWHLQPHGIRPSKALVCWRDAFTARIIPVQEHAMLCMSLLSSIP